MGKLSLGLSTGEFGRVGFFGACTVAAIVGVDQRKCLELNRRTEQTISQAMPHEESALETPPLVGRCKGLYYPYSCNLQVHLHARGGFPSSFTGGSDGTTRRINMQDEAWLNDNSGDCPLAHAGERLKTLEMPFPWRDNRGGPMCQCSGRIRHLARARYEVTRNSKDPLLGESR